MTADFILKMIQVVGFPITMAVWFMLRLEKRLDAFRADTNRTNVIIAVLVRVLAEKRTASAIPEEFVDQVTGVTDIPLPDSIHLGAAGKRRKKIQE